MKKDTAVSRNEQARVVLLWPSWSLAFLGGVLWFKSGVPYLHVVLSQSDQTNPTNTSVSSVP